MIQHNVNIISQPQLLAYLQTLNPEADEACVWCLIRKKPLSLGPEEIIRQLWVAYLILDRSVLPSSIELEHPVQMGVAVKRSDLALMNKNGRICAVVDFKQTMSDAGIAQVKSYLSATDARYGALISANEMLLFYRDPTAVHDYLYLTDLDEWLDKSGVQYDKNQALDYLREFRRTLAGSLTKTLSAAVIPDDFQIKPGMFDHNQIKLLGRDSNKLKISMGEKAISLKYSDFENLNNFRKHMLRLGLTLDPRLNQTSWNTILQKTYQSYSQSPEHSNKIVRLLAERGPMTFRMLARVMRSVDRGELELTIASLEQNNMVQSFLKRGRGRPGTYYKLISSGNEVSHSDAKIKGD